MTWQSARKDAELRLRDVLYQAEIRKVDPRNMRIRLPLFQDQDALDLIQPENSWPLAYHNQVTRAAMRILRAKKFQVDLVPITLNEYQNWLGTRENTAAMRAQYLGEKLR